jgi:hypothetical protein
MPSDAGAATPTTTIVTSDHPAGSIYGEPVTFTATVTPGGPGTPTGTVTFIDNGTTIGTATLNGAGQAVLTTATLTAAGSPHTITAAYSGDSTFSPSAGTTVQLVTPGTTTESLVTSQSPSVFGQPVTFTATVSPNAPSVVTPTGSVTFMDGATTIATVTLNSAGQATLSTSTLSVSGSSHTITATYLDSSGNYAPSTATVTQSVSPASTSTAITSSQNPSSFGQPVTFTATVTANPPSGATPAGSVTFTIDGSTVGTVALSASGTATFTTSTLSISGSPHTIVATYLGNSNFAGSLATTSQTVVQGTTTTITSSKNPSNVGDPVTFTATVTGSGGTPTGTVTFKDGATTLATVPLSGATATFATSSLTAGSHSITATYSGDANFGTSASPTLTQVVNQPGLTATTTTLVSSANPSNVGQPVTFTATVAPTSGAGTPTGTVTFTDGATSLGTGTLSGGQATFTTSSLSAGNHTITASYGSDANFSASTSPVLTQVVNQGAATTTTLASSVNPSNVGQAVTFTAAVTSSAGTPTGTVSFKDGATVIGTATLSTGAAVFITSSLTLGTHTITASYSGTTGFAASISPALTQTVQVPPDSVRLRALQVAVSKVEAQASGGAFEGAVAGAIADGFSEGGGALITPSGNGVRFNFAAEPDASLSGGRVVDQYDSVSAMRANALRDSGLSTMNQNLPASMRSFAPDASLASTRVDDAFSALAYAKPMVTKAPPLVPPAPKVWQLWADVRGTGWNTDPSAGDIRGGQINAIAGLTRKLTPDFLVGVLGGYENFDYTSQTLNGRLKGDGWTAGAYLGWRIWPGVRFDAAVGRSGISYNGASGTAAASFPGNRWLASAGLTGMYRTAWLEIEPSAKVYAIWERDSAYVDSLGTPQPENTFSSGRASTGVKVAYPMYWDAVVTLAPYAGLYADYYFSSDNAALLLPTQFVQGWAARTTAGISYTAVGGARLLIGGEVGGLGSQNFTVWSVRGRASVPF